MEVQAVGGSVEVQTGEGSVKLQTVEAEVEVEVETEASSWRSLRQVAERHHR